MRTASSGGTRVAAVMAASNRRELTLACLRSLPAQQVPGAALDDFVLDDGGLAVLLDTARQLRDRGREPLIVAGSTRHPDTGELTCGGVVHHYRWRPLWAELVEPGDAPRPCDTTNGNATLISRTVVQRIGNIDPAFVQQIGDFDYGLRTRAAGCSVWVAPGTIGTCAPHPERGPDEQASWEELRRLSSRKQLQPGPWAVCCRHWAGRLWPMYGLSPYARGGMRLIRHRVAARSSRGRVSGPVV